MLENYCSGDAKIWYGSQKTVSRNYMSALLNVDALFLQVQKNPHHATELVYTKILRHDFVGAMLALVDQPAEIGNDLQIEDADVGGAGDALMILDVEEEDQSDSGGDATPPVTPPREPSPVPREESPSRDSPPPPPPRYPDDGIDRDLIIRSTWGCFRITPKRNAKFEGFQVTCRFH